VWLLQLAVCCTTVEHPHSHRHGQNEPETIWSHHMKMAADLTKPCGHFNCAVLHPVTHPTTRQNVRWARDMGCHHGEMQQNCPSLWPFKLLNVLHLLGIPHSNRLIRWARDKGCHHMKMQQEFATIISVPFKLLQMLHLLRHPTLAQTCQMSLRQF